MIALCLFSLYGVQCHDAAPALREASASYAVVATDMIRPVDAVNERDRLAIADPLGFLKMCRAHYLETVSDYRCLFIKQERVRGVLTKEQRIQVKFREHPYSVDMHWIRNPRRASRVRYVTGRWVKNGREQAMIEPSGVLGLLVPNGVRRDIDGEAVLAESRKPVNAFGFKNTLDLIIKYCELAAGKADYTLRYVGKGYLDGRPSYILKRRLPLDTEEGAYPDRLLIVYIDEEWLVPTGVLSYADDTREKLVGRYLLTDVEFNVGLSAADF